MYKIGLSTCNNVTEQFFANCKTSGIEVVEISANKDNCDAVSFSDLSVWSKKYSVGIWSFHLPFAPFSVLDISNKNLSIQTIQYFSELIKKATDIGIDKFILHPSGEPIGDDERSERLKIAKESLHKLAEIASAYGGVIAVEDLPRTCLGNNSTEILDLISANDKLRVCFDTNHLLKENAVDFVKNVGDKIITTHISDYDFINERHWLPGEGLLDWQGLLKALKDVNYKGPWLYEIDLKGTKTICRERDLTHSDFVKNANEIFKNQPIGVFYTKKTV